TTALHRRFDDGAVTTALFRRRCLCHWFFTDIFRLKCLLPCSHWPFSYLFFIEVSGPHKHDGNVTNDARGVLNPVCRLLWDKRRTGPGDLCSWMLK
ncbi:DENN domain-containing protein 4C, partial [Frankliniella fusca]